jgi:hypothetical protein
LSWPAPSSQFLGLWLIGGITGALPLLFLFSKALRLNFSGRKQQAQRKKDNFVHAIHRIHVEFEISSRGLIESAKDVTARLSPIEVSS